LGHAKLKNMLHNIQENKSSTNTGMFDKPPKLFVLIYKSEKNIGNVKAKKEQQNGK